MTTHNTLTAERPQDLESLLSEAYAAEIPADLAAELERRSAALARWHPQTRRFPSLALPHLSVRVRLLAMVPVFAAIVLAQGAAMTGGRQGFYETEGGYAWLHGERLALTQSVDGYQIKLERAYADATQLVLAITVTNLRGIRGGWELGNVDVIDSAGVNWDNRGSQADARTVGTVEHLVPYYAAPAPAPAGRRAFTVAGQVTTAGPRMIVPPSVNPHISDPSPSGVPASARPPIWDPWPSSVPVNFSFSFDLTVAGGSATAPNASATSNGVTFTLDRMVTSPSMVVITEHVDGTFPAGSYGWWPNVYSVTHNGKALAVSFGNVSNIPRGDGAWVGELDTEAGVDDPSGDWTVTATELSGSAPTEGSNWDHEVRIQGNWTIHFTLP